VVPARILERRPLRGLWLFVDCISPGDGIVGSFNVKLFMRLERLRSMLFLTGEAESGERCKLALIMAAACREDKEGERGDGGPDCCVRRGSFVPAREIRRGL
jgi:hypothetical protein